MAGRSHPCGIIAAAILFWMTIGLSAIRYSAQAAEGSHATTRPGAPPSVRLVVGNDSMTFEGQKVTWDQLPDLLVKVPDRAETVLRISPQSDQVTFGRYRESLDRAGALVRRYGFRYLGDAGVPKGRAAESKCRSGDGLHQRRFEASRRLSIATQWQGSYRARLNRRSGRRGESARSEANRCAPDSRW